MRSAEKQQNGPAWPAKAAAAATEDIDLKGLSVSPGDVEVDVMTILKICTLLYLDYPGITILVDLSNSTVDFSY